MSEQEDRERTFVEEMEVAGNELLGRINDLMQDAKTRRVTIRTADGTELMTIPLTVGVVAGGLLTISAPLLAALGALAALVTRCKLEVVRIADEKDDDRSSEQPPPSA